MKVKALVAVVAAVSAGQVAALDLDTTQAIPDANTMVISGATAVDIQFANYIQQVCNPDTLDEYRQNSDVARAYSCTVSGVDDVPNGTHVLFRKASGGGSIEGVEPVFNEATVDGIVLDDNCVPNGTTPAGDPEWLCSDANVPVEAMVGVSDVEPDMFSIGENGGATLSGPGWSAAGQPAPANLQTFGIVITEDLRNALQAAQGLTVGSETVDNMPSMSDILIAQLFSGAIATWDQLHDGAGSPIATDGNDVEICMRARGSGTGAQFNAHYLKNPCIYRGASTLAPLNLAVGNDCDGNLNNEEQCRNPFTGVLQPPHTHRVAGSSDMGKCLTRLNDDPAGRTAIGVQSLEKVGEERTDRNKFRYVRINGVAPTLENVHAGLYQNTAAASLQWNSRVTGVRLGLAEELRNTAQDDDAVSTFNASLYNDGSSPFNNPAILNTAGSETVHVGSLAFAGVAGNAAATNPFDPATPVTVLNYGLSDPISCSIPAISGPISVATQGVDE